MKQYWQNLLSGFLDSFRFAYIFNFYVKDSEKVLNDDWCKLAQYFSAALNKLADKNERN